MFGTASLLRATMLTIAWLVPTTGWADEVTDPTGQSYHLVPAAHFEMGSGPTEYFRQDHASTVETDNRPRHAVILTRPYYVAATEVTVGQFRQFVRETGYRPTSSWGVVGWDPVNDDEGRIERSFSAADRFTWQSPGFDQTDDHPVTGVSLADAQAYCRWLSRIDGEHSYRLPTEAEWEWAARGGLPTPFGFGKTYRGVIHRHANVADVSLERIAPGRACDQWLIDVDHDPPDGHATTAPVGSFQANPFGLFDMHGNVWEWCADRYLDTSYQQWQRRKHGEVRPRAVNPKCDQPWNEHGPWHVIRGGSWFNSPRRCRSAARGVFHADDAACYLGFRVVRDVSEDVAAIHDARHAASQTSLRWLIENVDEVREYDAGVIRVRVRANRFDASFFDALENLQYAVDVSILPPGDLRHDQLQRFADVPRLAGLNLSTRVNDLSAETFAVLAGQSGLRSIQVTGNPELRDAWIFPHLKDADSLESLSLMGSEITDDGLRQLPVGLPLRRLHLHDTACQGEAVARFAGAQFEEISLGQLTDAGAEQLSEFRSVRDLNVAGSPISHNGLESIARLGKLRQLNLRGCADLAASDFGALTRLDRLVEIDLRKTSAGDDSVPVLIKLPRLRELRIDASNMTRQGLAGIGELVGLRGLAIDQCPSPIGRETIIRWLSLPNLDRLSLSGSVSDSLTKEITPLLDDYPEVRVKVGK